MILELKIEGQEIYSPIKNKMLALTPEERVRQEYICRLVNHYGYKLEQMDESVRSKMPNPELGNACADIIVWSSIEDKEKNNSPLIVVECKAEQVTIREEDYYRGANYSSLVSAPFFVTTNLKETRIFPKIFKVGKIGAKLNLEEILNIPHATEANNEKEINILLGQNKEFIREEFCKRLSKCHNIIRNNDKLSPEAAFDEISKVLFIKSLYERENQKGQILNMDVYTKGRRNYNPKTNDDLQYYKHLFDKVKSEKSYDDLFESNETIRIRENSFEAIIKELEIYNLSTTSDDIKGIAFERFLGKTFRGELGQFFTPRTIVDYMVEILDPVEGEVVCDPCCGSGGFLIKTFDYIRSKIENSIQLAKDEIKQKYYSKDYHTLNEKQQLEIECSVNEQLNFLNTELDTKNMEGRLSKLSHKCIYGTDANPRMARTAKMNMIMHGDGHGGVHNNDGLININGIYEERFDVILTNPPFGARVDKSLKIHSLDIPSQAKTEKYIEMYGEDYLKKVINPLIAWAEYDNGKDLPKGRSILSLFETGGMSSLTEVLFIERCLNLLKPGGRMGIVLPEGILNNPKLQKVRDYVESRAKIINITSIPQDVFIASGATIKPSLLFFKKFTLAEAVEYAKITEAAERIVKEKYKLELREIEIKSKIKSLDSAEKKTLKDKTIQIMQVIDDEIKLYIKAKFDYDIPVIEVEKAGISTTGASIDNELPAIVSSFRKYQIQNPLWDEKNIKIQYGTYENKFQRKSEGCEPELFYEKYFTTKAKNANYK